ncbi:NADPH oxidase organizer 1a [Esox lucius]|uniref:SH3 domain-containing protein n=1 Tax=Esox lucius TaxID=8010 RepID=A0A3P8XPP0_ESOLU|nr:NADPH oxidase organizer 1a [Esox lucius]
MNYNHIGFLLAIMEEQRYPVNVRLIGIIQKEKSKMYITSVLWSDQNDIIVYRTLKDFKTLHKQMKKTFPPANPLKKSDRIIPMFRDWKTKKSKSLVQLKYLEKYCSKLLSSGPLVSQCRVLIQFFHPKDQDLQPDFAKNSIVIMPSEDHHFNAGNVTQPFLTQTYQCVAPYETKDIKNRPFKVVMNEHVDVLIKDKAGWWLVENEDKRIAWFPAPYLEKIDEDEDEMEGFHGESVLYSAAKRYSANNADEVSVEIGSVVEILQKSDNGWWLIRYQGQTGYIPAMYLKPYKNPRLRLEALQQDLCSSSLNLSQLQVPGAGHSLARQAVDLNRSQGNLLRPPVSQPPMPNQLVPIKKSRSLNALSELRPGPPPVIVTPPAPDCPTRGNPEAPVVIETDGKGDRRGSSVSKSSVGSEGSDFSDFSLSPTSCESSLNLSSGEMHKLLERSRVQEACCISPDRDGLEGRMVHSTSENNLFNVPPSMPKVPPRPRPQEILTRCTTVTRKKASKASLSPQPAEVERY